MKISCGFVIMKLVVLAIIYISIFCKDLED